MIAVLLLRGCCVIVVWLPRGCCVGLLRGCGVVAALLWCDCRMYDCCGVSACKRVCKCVGASSKSVGCHIPGTAVTTLSGEVAAPGAQGSRAQNTGGRKDKASKKHACQCVWSWGAVRRCSQGHDAPSCTRPCPSREHVLWCETLMRPTPC